MPSLHRSRLWWDSHLGRGVATHDGVVVELKAPPVLPGLDGLQQLDYEPRVVGLVRIGCERQRELTDIERRQCSTILRRVAFGARTELLQPMGRDLADEL